jgi:hypothetical protein
MHIALHIHTIYYLHLMFSCSSKDVIKVKNRIACDPIAGSGFVLWII